MDALDIFAKCYSAEFLFRDAFRGLSPNYELYRFYAHVQLLTSFHDLRGTYRVRKAVE